MSKKISSVHVEMSADSAKLEAGLKKAKGSLEEFKGKAQGVAKPINDIKSILTNYAVPIGAATSAFGALATASKMAFDAGKMGADLLYMQGKFDNLTASIGGTSDALLKDLRAATRGMVSDAKLVQSAGDFMALGLAKSRDEVVRLTTVAGALGMDMNQLVLTLTNQTTMRFDALGVSVDGFDAKVKALKDTGMDANAAFKEAFLQQAEAQLAKVGNKADSGAGAIMRMEASVENLKNNLRMGLAPAVIAVSNAINDMITNGQPAKDAIDTQAKSVGSLTGTYEEYVEQLKKVAREQGYTVRIVNGTLQAFNSSGMNVTYMLDGMSKTSYTLEKSLLSANSAAREQAAIMDDVAGATGDAAGAQNNLNGALLTAEGVMQAYSKQLLFKMASEGLGAEAALDLAFAMGLVDKNTVTATLKVAELTRKYDLNKNGAIDAGKEAALYAGAVRALADNIAALEDKTVKLTVHISATGNLTALGAVANGTAGQIVPGKPGIAQYATGGPVFSGQSYIVGEHGPEVFTPSSSGGITANNRVGGGSPIINIYPLPGQDENAIAARVVAMLRRGNTRGMAGAGYAGV